MPETTRAHDGTRGAARAVMTTWIRPFALLCLALSACQADFTSCPPAPFRVDDGATCSFDGQCTYGVPLGLGADRTDFCNGQFCYCDDGRLVCGSSLRACLTKIIPECPAGASEGASCEVESNGECAVPGPDADLSAGIINGQVCACDRPGPQWRCLPVEKVEL
jgi:hypothetical protein